MSGNDGLVMPEDRPDHPVIGNYFKAHGKAFSGSEIYFCDSYDPRQGFWMTSLSDSENRRNVSERAIDRTFHTVYGVGADGPLHCSWGRLQDEETALVREHIESRGVTPPTLRY